MRRGGASSVHRRRQPPSSTFQFQVLRVGDSRGRLGGNRCLIRRLPRAVPREFIEVGRGMKSLVLVCFVVSFHQRRTYFVGTNMELFRGTLHPREAGKGGLLCIQEARIIETNALSLKKGESLGSSTFSSRGKLKSARVDISKCRVRRLEQLSCSTENPACFVHDIGHPVFQGGC